MKRYKRIALAMLALSILAVSLAFNSGAAHAQTRTELAPQHPAIAADGSNSVSTAWWGAELCVSHSTLSWLEQAGAGVGWAYAIGQLTKVVSFGAAVPVAIFYGAFIWYLNIRDGGRGVCVAATPVGTWVWGQ
jgi:hypothetical protein